MTAPLRAAGGGRIRVVLFDGFAIFDPRPVALLARNVIGERGADLAALWRRKQFEYCWLRTTANRYSDFSSVTEDALRFAARELRVAITPDQQARLLQAFLHLSAWSDAEPSLTALRKAGLALGFLSNLTEPMLRSSAAFAHLGGLFDFFLSTDRVRAYKPSPVAYRMGIEATRLDRDRILFVPSAGWDAAGAKWFGYPTYWVDRTGSPPDELGAGADATGRDLTDLVRYLAS